MRHEFTRKQRPIVMLPCSWCGTTFDRGYRISATRAAKPQFCSKDCKAQYERDSATTAMVGAFWARTERQNTGCLHWTGRLDSNGYGRIDYLGQPRLAHRVAYFIAYGVEPGEMSVCHACDNPTCVEPKHLWLGTHKENMLDAAAKNRMGRKAPKGERVGTSKLTEDAVREILASGEAAKNLAAKYAVTREAIYLIRKRKNWAWVNV